MIGAQAPTANVTGRSVAWTPQPSRRLDLSAGFVILAAYVIITRVGGLEAAKIGFNAGGVPLFLTDLVMFVCLLLAFATRPGAMIMWTAGGTGLGLAGRCAWLIIAMSVFHTVLALPTWGILAIRDLAIFAYALFFPLGLLLMDTKAKAAALVRVMAYAGVALAALLTFDVFTGLHWFYEPGERVLTTDRVKVASYAGGDEGGMSAFAFVAMLAFLLVGRGGRLRSGIFLAIALLGVALPQTRAATLGMALAAGLAFLVVKTPARLALAAMALTGFGFAGALIALLPETGLAKTLWAFATAITSGASISGDDNAYFRFMRWNAVIDVWLKSPFIGMGFGKPLIPEFLIQASEKGLNAGLPHNSFLTTAARLGVLGVAFLLIPWLIGIGKAIGAMRQGSFPREALACALILTCMLGYANFVLFLERPMHAATLWLMIAAACRLAEPEGRA